MEVIRNIQKQNPIEAKTELKKQTLSNYTQAEVVLKYLFRISFRNRGETLPGTKYCLSNITRLISKLIGVKFRNSSGEINDSTFHPGWSKLYNIHRRGENTNSVLWVVVLQSTISSGNSLGRIQPRY